MPPLWPMSSSQPTGMFRCVSLHRNSNRKVGDTQPVVGNVSRPSSTLERQCFYCRKPGHLIADCSVWKRKQQGSVSVPKPPKGEGLIKTVTPNNESLALKSPDDCFKYFIFDGFVSLTSALLRSCVTQVALSPLFLLVSCLSVPSLPVRRIQW